MQFDCVTAICNRHQNKSVTMQTCIKYGDSQVQGRVQNPQIRVQSSLQHRLTNLTNLCVPVATNTSRRYLRSATHGDLQVPSTRTVTYGPRSFAVSGPTIWNTVPSTLRVSTTTLGQFQSGLKTILFRLAYGT